MRGDRDKFEPTMYVTAYEYARDGLSDTQIGKALGATGTTFRRWCNIRPALADAVARGRYRRDPNDALTFHEYLFDRLSPNLRGVWEEINECETLENGVERVEALMKNHGIRARQHLFLYALTQSNFNVSKAMQKTGVSRRSFEAWRKNDPEFTELVDEIHWHKGNFFESAFIGRVAAGDTPAIIHAVKTKCRDRGYNDKVEIVHSGTIDSGSSFSITELDLDIETRKKILEAIRNKQAAMEATQAGVAMGGATPTVRA